MQLFYTKIVYENINQLSESPKKVVFLFFFIPFKKIIYFDVQHCSVLGYSREIFFFNLSESTAKKIRNAVTDKEGKDTKITGTNNLEAYFLLNYRYQILPKKIK